MVDNHLVLTIVDELDRAVRRGEDTEPSALSVAGRLDISVAEAVDQLMALQTLDWIASNADRAARVGDGFEAEYWQLTPDGARELSRRP